MPWTGEKIGRLKLNGRLLGHSPLSRLEELELLSLGVGRKLLLWRSLHHAVQAGGGVFDTDLETLIKRARSRRRLLERLRLRAAAQALAPPVAGP